MRNIRKRLILIESLIFSLTAALGLCLMQEVMSQYVLIGLLSFLVCFVTGLIFPTVNIVNKMNNKMDLEEGSWQLVLIRAIITSVLYGGILSLVLALTVSLSVNISLKQQEANIQEEIVKVEHQIESDEKSKVAFEKQLEISKEADTGLAEEIANLEKGLQEQEMKIEDYNNAIVELGTQKVNTLKVFLQNIWKSFIYGVILFFILTPRVDKYLLKKNNLI